MSNIKSVDGRKVYITSKLIHLSSDMSTLYADANTDNSNVVDEGCDIETLLAEEGTVVAEAKALFLRIKPDASHAAFMELAAQPGGLLHGGQKKV
jgi:hypothetical protein